ncbi:MAG: hypothetical protein D4R73_05930 [Deltaproteobacteria bacterium]|nr:MAG: hypothetical protein D4R73_05930 [Deltaproteobacteria bacterium]
MGALDRKALLAPEALKTEKVALGKDDFVFVRQMTAHEHSGYEQTIAKEVVDEKTGAINFVRDMKDFRAKLAVHTLCDEKGVLLLKSEDYLALSQSMLATKLDKISSVALKLNKIGEAEKEALVKN